MKAIAVTNTGIEDVAAHEITSLIDVKTTTGEGQVFFEFKKFEDLFLVCYQARSVNTILFVIAEITKPEELKKVDFSEWIDKTFTVKSKNKELEAALGEHIPGKVDFKNPDVQFVAFEDKNIVLCIDFSGDLSKRDYRIFLGKEALKGTTAFAALHLAQFTDDKLLIDPVCRSGVIPIEAALFASAQSPQYYNKDKFLFRKLKKFNAFDFDAYFAKLDEAITTPQAKINAIDNNFKSLQSSQKNAKIAGMHKNIQFSRQDLQWLDTKFKKQSVDCIVTMPLELTKQISEKKIEQHYDELCNQAAFILKKKGNLTVVFRAGKELFIKAAEKYKLKQTHERTVLQGKEAWSILQFTPSVHNP